MSIVQMPAGVPVGTLAIGEAGAKMRRSWPLPLSPMKMPNWLKGWTPGAPRTADVQSSPVTTDNRPKDNAIKTIGIVGGGQLGRMLAWRRQNWA